MPRTLPAALIGASIAISVSAHALALSSAEVNAIAKAVTVQIQGADSSGSGVLIRKEGNTYTVVTAAHVVSEQTAYKVVAPDGQRYPFTSGSVQKHPDVDLAIAQFSSNTTYPVATLGDPQGTIEGTMSYVSGFPARTAALTESIYSFTKGEITAKATQPFKDGYGLVYTNTTLPGMSGGPVFNGNGQLIGIHGRADAKVQPQDEYLNPKIYVKSGVNLGIPITAVFALVPKQQLIFTTTPDLSPQPTVNQSLVNDLLAQANFKRRQNDLMGAITSLDQALQLDPNNINALNERGDIYLTLREDLSAAASFNRAVQVNPNFAEGYYNLGLAYLRSGNRDEAIRSFQAAATRFKVQGKTEKYKATQERLKGMLP